MFKRKNYVVLAFMISIIMILSTACQSSGDQTATTTTTRSTTGTQQTTTQGTGTTQTEPVTYTPYKAVTLMHFPQRELSTEQEKMVKDQLFEKTGVDLSLVIIQTADYGARVNLMLASRQQLDFYSAGHLSVIQGLKQGHIIPLEKDILDRYENLRTVVKPEGWQKVTYKGQFLGFPHENANPIVEFLQIRTDWLEKLNLPVPQNIADFEAVMQAFKFNDPDGNNVEDTIPLMSDINNFTRYEATFGPAYLPQAMAWWPDNDGKIKPPELHKNYKTMLAKIREWYEKGYIYLEDHVATRAQRLELVAQNKVGSFTGHWSRVQDGEEVLKRSVPEAHYEPLLIKGTLGINKYLYTVPFRTLMPITAMCKDPEAIIRLFDYAISEEGFNLVNFGVEGETYNKLADGTMEFITSNPDDKYDQTKANYNRLYAVFTTYYDSYTVWPLSDYLNRAMTYIRNKMAELPSFIAIDGLIEYDQTEWKTADKLGDLNTFFTEQKTKIILGETSVDEWDNIVKSWLDMGGAQMIEDRNTQFIEFSLEANE